MIFFDNLIAQLSACVRALEQQLQQPVVHAEQDGVKIDVISLILSVDV